jgi:hypothetical protein
MSTPLSVPAAAKYYEFYSVQIWLTCLCAVISVKLWPVTSIIALGSHNLITLSSLDAVMSMLLPCYISVTAMVLTGF